MGGSPEVLITDEETGLLAAIRELKEDRMFKGVHLLDAYHILKNVRKKLDEREHLYFFR